MQAYREKHKSFEAQYRWLKPSERDELRKLTTQEEKEAYLKKKLQERKDRQAS